MSTISNNTQNIGPMPMVQVLKRGQFTEVPESEVDYEFEAPSALFNRTINLIPMQNAVTAQRAFYADKFFNQALPLNNGEIPYIQTLKDPATGESFERFVGRKTGVVTLDPEDGESTILAVSPDYIKYRNSKGQVRQKSLYNNFKFNRKSGITNIPLVKQGDIVSGDRLLAKTNYTADDGTLSLGLNARIALVPFKGWSADDAVVISEDFAKRLASQHMYTYRENDDKSRITGKTHFTSLFPDQFTKEQLENIDENGVIKVGSRVKEGDPLILSTRPRMLSSQDQVLGRLSKHLKNTRNDASEVWDHHDEGVVTDVIKTKNGYKVNVSSINPARVGDKLTERSGNKSTIAKIIPQHLMPRTKDGQPVDMLFNQLGLPCYDGKTEILTKEDGWIPVKKTDLSHTYMTLNPDTLHMEWQKATDVHHYYHSGEMYGMENEDLSICVTPTHRHFTMPLSGPADIPTDLNDMSLGGKFELKQAARIAGEPRKYLKAAKWAGESLDFPQVIKIAPGQEGEQGLMLPLTTWLEILGYVVGDGICRGRRGKEVLEFGFFGPRNEDNLAYLDHLRNLFESELGLTCRRYGEVYHQLLGVFHTGLINKVRQYARSICKHMPRKLLDLPPAYAGIFLSAAISAIRHIPNFNRKEGYKCECSFTYTGHGDLDGIQEMFAKNGAALSFTRINRHAVSCGVKPDAGVCVNTGETPDDFVIDRYKGKVHCVTVPNGVVLVRRNGKAYFSGNSRVNANLIYEVLLGKVAEKTGKRYTLPSFNKAGERWYDFVENELKQAGLSDTEELYDPELDRTLDQPVTVGNGYVMKLHHTADSKLSARGQGRYDANFQPSKGGEEGQMCFAPKQVIHTENGPIDISTLCEKRLRVPVKTYDFDKQEWTYAYVTDWFVRRAPVEDLITVKFSTNSFRNADSPYKIFNHGCLHVTRNHMVFREDGSKVPIGTLKPGDFLYTYGPVPTEDQWALLYGTMLGDGYAHKNQDGIAIQHSVSQKNYVSWKQNILASLNAKMSDHNRISSENSLQTIWRKQKVSIRTSTVHISYAWIAKKLRQECYSNGIKTITDQWLQKLTALSIVVLLLDDGCVSYDVKRHKYGVTINTLAFTPQENEKLAKRIYELTGLKFKVRRIKNTAYSFLVSYQKKTCEDVAALIGNYIPLESIPGSKWQLKELIAALGIQPTYQYKLFAKRGLIPVEIRSIEPYKHDKPGVSEINVYDFTVEPTHSYLAGNVLVSNSKRISGLESVGLLSAGAYGVIKDAIHLRGEKNDDYWRQVRMGETPTLAKKSPFVWDKYLALMQGAGINAIDKGNGILQASPFTDRQFENMSPVELENPEIIDLKNLKPVKGGLFDPANSLSNKWAKITLDRPYPNPGFEDAIVSLLGIRKSDMYEIIKGDKSLEGYGKGSIALQKALADIDMDEMMAKAKNDFKHGPKSQKQKALNRMQYIKGLQKNGLTPDELMITKVPVIPASFRPYSMMGDTFIPGDVNELYKDVFLMRDAQRQLADTIGEDEAMANSLNMYNSIKALYGLGDTMNKKLQQRGVSGFMEKLVGGTSKFSFLNRSVNSKPVDFTGRAVIDVNPELGMDQIMLPRQMAMTMFAPYVQRKLVQNGMKPSDAIVAVTNKDDSAIKALDAVVKERPVMYSRAPAWHKYNTLGGWAVLHDGDNILINPLNATGMGADYDGNCVIGDTKIIVEIPKSKLRELPTA